MTFTGRQGLALVRMVVGLGFLVSGGGKIAAGWLASGEPLVRSLGPNMERAEPFYRSFLQGTVVPNAGTFAQLTAVGEVVAGSSLLLGLLTRLGALTGMWLLLNFMAMKGTLIQGWGTGMTYSDRLYFAGALASLLAAAGLVWGLDGALRPWLARIPVVRWLAGAGGPVPVTPVLVPAVSPATGVPLAYPPAAGRQPAPIAAYRDRRPARRAA
jgi:uncharacterized membrane protein YphA (DoxX/SURF4 family)